MRRTLLPLFGAVLLLGQLAGCQVSREPNYEWLPWINHMFFSSAAESQAPSPVNAAGKPIFANGRAMQDPPKGTIPRGFSPTHLSNSNDDRELAGKELKNPYDATPENLARGRERFEIFCAPCHGTMGAGDGLVAKRGIPPFPIDKPDSGAGVLPDGHVFHIMTVGRGAMPSYASQIDAADRWKILLHLRRLQQLPR